MKKITYYWGELKNSFYNPSFYNSVENRSLSQAVKFLIAISLASAVLFVVVASVRAVPEIIKLSKGDVVEKNYPENLVVIIKDGIASSNVEEPFKIPMSREDAERSKVENLVVINTQEELSLDQIAAYNSFVVLLKDKVVFAKSSDEIRIFSLKEVKDLTINEENVKVWLQKGVSWFHFLILPLALLMIVFVLFFSVITYMVMTLVLACATFLYAKFRGHVLTYKQAYKVSLYAMGPLIALDAVGMLFGIMSLPFKVTLLIFAVVIVANVARKTEVVASDTTPPLT